MYTLVQLLCAIVTGVNTLGDFVAWHIRTPQLP